MKATKKNQKAAGLLEEGAAVEFVGDLCAFCIWAIRNLPEEKLKTMLPATVAHDVSGLLLGKPFFVPRSSGYGADLAGGGRVAEEPEGYGLPVTGEPCGCRRGVERDNCPNC